MAFERGLEWERPHVMARLPAEPLPPVADVIRMAAKEFDIKMSDKREGRSNLPSWSREHNQGVGPRLPLHRPRPAPSTQDISTQRRPPATTFRPAPIPERSHSPPSSPRQPVPNPAAEAVCSAQGELLQAAAVARAAEAGEAERKVDEENLLEIPWTEEELRLVFNKFDADKDNEVHAEDLVPMLRYLGAIVQYPEEVVALVREQTHYATLEWAEFLEFVRRFREYDIANLRIEFQETDADSSESLDVQELQLLLERLGYNATIEITTEALEFVDGDKSGDVNFREFVGLREYLRATEGFSKADISELRMLHGRAAGKGEELPTDQVFRIIAYLGYSASPSQIDKICSEVDADGSGEVSFLEMLKVIRRIRDIEREALVRVLLSRGTLGCAPSSPKHSSNAKHTTRTKRVEECLPVEDLGIALLDLGYFVSEDSVFEILDDMVTESDEKVTLEELTTFVRAYRRTEGFSRAEFQELSDAFNLEDKSSSGSIGALELSRVLRWFGFSKSLQKVQGLMEDIDFDGSGMLEINELVKLMRQLQQAEARKRRSVFGILDPGRTGQVDVAVLGRAAAMLFEVPDAEMVRLAIEAAVPGGTVSVNMTAFEAFFKHYRRLVVEQIRANQGYSPAEVLQLRLVFGSYDKDKSGTIESSELQKLIAEYFPDATKSRSSQHQIQKLLALLDVGAKGGCVDFAKFLWLMRKCDDLRDETDVKLEAEVARECGLSTEEVEGFRQIFSSSVNWTGELDVAALTELLRNVIDLGENAAEDLVRIVRETHPEGREVARFPQFLRLVKRLTSDNALGINEAAARVLRRAEKLKKTRMQGVIPPGSS